MLEVGGRIEIDARSSSMRQLIVGILIAPLFVNSGCFERGNAQPASPILSVEALDVLTLASPPGTRMMQGKFKIGPPSPGDRQIVSSGAGGACLIAQFKGVDKSCRQDSECNLPLAGPPAATWHGYCVGNDIQTGTPAGKCWLKPSEAYCLKGPTVGVGSHVTPPVDRTEVYTEAAKHSAGPVKWAVLGCLNGVPTVATDGPPCRAGERMFDLGATKTVP